VDLPSSKAREHIGPSPNALLSRRPFALNVVENAIRVLAPIGVNQAALDIDATLRRPLVRRGLLIPRRLVVLMRQQRCALGRFHPLGLDDEMRWRFPARTDCLLAPHGRDHDREIAVEPMSPDSLFDRQASPTHARSASCNRAAPPIAANLRFLAHHVT